MKLLSKRQLKELVLYSHQHIARLEKAGEADAVGSWQNQLYGQGLYIPR